MDKIKSCIKKRSFGKEKECGGGAGGYNLRQTRQPISALVLLETQKIPLALLLYWTY
jgi:hypothetical protein